MERIKDLMEMASDLNIEIFRAHEDHEATRMHGIHILNPDFNALEEAIMDAESKGYNAVVIHSNQTWPFEAKKEMVRAS